MFGKLDIIDLVGIIFIFLAIRLLYHKMREKVLVRYTAISDCPECGGHLERIPQLRRHTLYEWLLAIRIYNFQCTECDYAFFNCEEE